MASPAPSLTAMATQILEPAMIVDAYLEEHILPLSISADPALGFPVPSSEEHVQAARQTLLDLSKTLTENVTGSKDPLMEHALGGHHNSSAMRTISSLKLYENAPESGSVTFEDIASKPQPPLAVGFVKTLLCYAMTIGMFCQPRPGHAAHTGPTILLLKTH